MPAASSSANRPIVNVRNQQQAIRVVIPTPPKAATKQVAIAPKLTAPSASVQKVANSKVASGGPAKK
jgi:hypothetical protein